MKTIIKISVYFIFLLSAINLSSQEYQLVWEENFDGTELNSDVWSCETQVGVWNTEANRELQHYRQENVEVGLDDEGNSALIITAKRENYNGYQFTSGRIHTKGKVGVLYGKVEARIKLPVLENGLWPAFWMLGTQNVWPNCGEIDIFEAGHFDGISQNKQNSTINGALHWSHSGSHAMHSAGYNHSVDAPAPVGTNLYQYNLFTLEWTPNVIKMFLNNQLTPYFEMNIEGNDIEEFRSWTHYFVLNLAVGGQFPNIFNPADITVPMPAKMYVDYIKVYQKENEGVLDVTPSFTKPTGDTFAVLSENTNIADRMIFDNVANTIQIWDGSLMPLSGDVPVYEGDDALSFRAPASRTWFGFGINASNTLDLDHYNNGYLHFALRTSDNNNFWIGFGDVNGKESKVLFNNGSDPYGFQRDGLWHQITIPISSLNSGSVDLSKLTNVFMLGGEGAISNILVDDIYFSKSATPIENPKLNANRNNSLDLPGTSQVQAVHYGIFTENPNVTDKFLIDDVTGHIYNWDNTVKFIDGTPYDGDEVIAIQSNGNAGWWGFGIHDLEASDLSFYNNGYLHLAIKTTSDKSFKISVEGANSTKAEFLFNIGNDPVGFARDGQWHRVTLQFPESLDLSKVAIPFSVTQGSTGLPTITDLSFDDIIFSTSNVAPSNPNLYVDNGEEKDPIIARWDSWFGDGGNANVTYGGDQEVKIDITNPGWAKHSVQVFIDNLDLTDGDYVISFNAKAIQPRVININVGKGLDAEPWFVEFMPQESFEITNEWKFFTHYFTKENSLYDTGKLVFEFGNINDGGTLQTSVFLDNVEIKKGYKTGVLKNSVNSFRLISNCYKDFIVVESISNISLFLYNAQGQLIDNIDAQQGNNTISTSSLPNGLYFLRGNNDVVKFMKL